MPTATRVFNFSAGPAVLPLAVLEEAQRDLIALPGVGMTAFAGQRLPAAFERNQARYALARALPHLNAQQRMLVD